LKSGGTGFHPVLKAENGTGFKPVPQRRDWTGYNPVLRAAAGPDGIQSRPTRIAAHSAGSLHRSASAIAWRMSTSRALGSYGL